MKISFSAAAVFAALVVVTGCGSRSRDFKAEQQDYEKLKKEVEAKQGEAFHKVQEALLQKVNQIATVTTAAEHTSFAHDSTFFYKEDTIRFLSVEDRLSHYGNQDAKILKYPNAIVVHTPAPEHSHSETPNKNAISFMSTRIMERLGICFRDTFFVDCFKLSEMELKAFTGVRYVFVVDEVLYSKPEVNKGAKEFNGGYYLSSVSVFDLKGSMKDPICRFPVVGQNSQTIQVGQYVPEDMKLQSDLKKNCFEAFNNQCSKHFSLSTPLQFVSFF